MNRKRIIAIGKLVLLFGTPLAVILGLFSCGVYFGVQHRADITRFERDWLGLDVEVPGEPATGAAKGDAKGDAKAPDDAKPRPPSDAKAPDDAKPEPPSDAKAPDDAKPEPPPPDPEPTPVVVPPSNTGGVPAPLPPPATRVDPLDEPLAARLRASTVVRVKVLVDASVVAEHPEWIDYAQRTVSRASQIYQEQLGISLELSAVGRWSVAPQGMDTAALLADLHAQPREGADLLLGLTSRPYDGTSSGADLPGAAFNGTHAVVHATPGHREGHLRTLLHEVSLLLGATGVADPADPAHVGGSWMSYAAVPETQAAWIDPANRQRILERKDLPFAPEAAEQP
jgi:hypothetical protein